jgi:hypothetical protein
VLRRASSVEKSRMRRINCTHAHLLSIAHNNTVRPPLIIPRNKSGVPQIEQSFDLLYIFSQVRQRTHVGNCEVRGVGDDELLRGGGVMGQRGGRRSAGGARARTKSRMHESTARTPFDCSQQYRVRPRLIIPRNRGKIRYLR